MASSSGNTKSKQLNLFRYIKQKEEDRSWLSDQIFDTMAQIASQGSQPNAVFMSPTTYQMMMGAFPTSGIVTFTSPADPNISPSGIWTVMSSGVY